MRALKDQNAAAGALLNSHQATLATPINRDDAPITTQSRTIPIDWTDYNGHMNESCYGQVFSDSANIIMRLVGADAAYIASGNSYFTVDIQIRFLAETLAGQTIKVQSRVLEGRGKKLRIYHEMLGADGTLLATGEQLLIHVNLTTRRACEPTDAVLHAVQEMAAAHAALARPDAAN